ncbi:Oxidoreductase, short chain dehydrogenase/reductase family [Flavobacterium daejeonense]|nr:Oxidoreductase, short chain dehydrogenase/reductase family [Flavobacterium daejeonense]
MEWVLITGASSSIGFSIAMQLRNQFNLLLAVRNEDLFKSKFSQLLEGNENHLIWEVDFQSDDVANSFQKILELQELKISHVVHASGYFSISPLRLLKSEEIENSYKVNVLSVVEICSILAKKDYKKNLKNILFISSISAIRGNSGYSLYSGAKSALHGFAKSLCVELKPTKVNTIILGPVITEKTKALLEPKQEYLNIHMPLGLASAEVLNPWVQFLLTQETWMTGQEIIIDGGATAL